MTNKLYLKKSRRYKVGNGFTVQFFIYKNGKDLRKSTDLTDKEETVGFFHYPGNSKNTTIHLCLSNMEAGIVAHEIQHLIICWAVKSKLDLMGKHWEKICYTTGRITKRYWTWFYKNFKKLEPQ